MKRKKKVEKKRVEAIASAGPAVAGKGRFGRDMEGNMEGNGQGSSTPVPVLVPRMGGRIVYASRIPPRPKEA